MGLTCPRGHEKCQAGRSRPAVESVLEFNDRRQAMTDTIRRALRHAAACAAVFALAAAPSARAA